MTIKTVIVFLIGLVFIIGSIYQSFKKIKSWNTLTGKQKYDAFVWILLGVIIIAISAFILVMLVSDAIGD